MKSFSAAFFGFFHGGKYIFQRKLFAYSILPGFINTLLIAGLVFGLFQLARFTVAPWLDAQSAGIATSWLRTALTFAARGLLAVAACITGLILYKPFAAVIISPFLALLCGKVMESELGIKLPFSVRVFLADIAKILPLTLMNSVVWEVMLLATLFILGFVPVINVLIIPLPALVSGYFLSKAHFDLPLEAFRYRFGERRTLPGVHRRFIAGNGTALMLMQSLSVAALALPLFALMIPVLGVVIAVILFLVLGITALAVLFIAPACSTVNCCRHYLLEVEKNNYFKEQVAER